MKKEFFIKFSCWWYSRKIWLIVDLRKW